ncbi:hypothetical protein CAC42_282 [Sphaceloma murrayae]|uniref:Uncharacterized protein n=1 Tax=Sphaceloma murrayae TaxID=2082308 RepID=A0A2K1QN39_9PEZI|nr:hypothetical protein CAC42_282 [Sphaceloma murrayae]
MHPENHHCDFYDDTKVNDNFYDAPERAGLPGSSRQKLLDYGSEAKQKSKHIWKALKHTRPSVVDANSVDSPVDLDDDPAFDPALLVGRQKSSAGGTTDRLLGTAWATGKAILSPKHAAKKKAVSKVAIEERPYLSQQADAEYLAAHDDLQHTRASTAATSDEDEDKLGPKRNRIDELGENRDARKVAWTTTRHVHRVAVVANQSPPRPDPDAFYTTDDHSGKRKFEWLAYLHSQFRYVAKKLAIESMGEIDVHPQQPFSKEVCIKYLERILIATAPWQAWVLSLRAMYRWEDPRKSARWAAIWFLIWYSDHVMTFILSYMAFIVLENRFRSKRAESLQESYSRSGTSDHTAQRLNELIHRHGPGEWFDPLVQDAGPVAQMQLSDLADFLEILANFYDWKNPSRTWGTLFWYACAILTGILTPTGYSWKIMTMFALLAFFLSRPIASRHPQYRHVVNALKWIFWDIPTDAEWSFVYLRRKAQEMREGAIHLNVQKHFDHADSDHLEEHQHITTEEIAPGSSSDSFTSASSILPAPSPLEALSAHRPLQSLPARHKGLSCLLCILPSGLSLRYNSSLRIGQDTIWYVPWADVREIRKADASTLAKVTSSEGIELVVSGPNGNGTNNNDDDDHHHHHHHDSHPQRRHDTVDAHLMNEPNLRVLKLEGLRSRDRAFNLILGFSGLRFQVVPPLSASPSLSSGRGPHKGLRAHLRTAVQGTDQHIKEPEQEYDAYQAFRKEGFWEGWFV